MFVGLDKICTFVKSKQFERDLKLNIYDKELPAKGSNTERFVLPVLDCLDNPKAVTPHTNLILMSKEKQFVTNSQCAKVTPTQNNQNKLHSFIIRYVKLRLACDHLFTEPIEPEYKAIYIQHLKSLAV